MRDSIALLDQVSILGESKEITEEDINNLLGRISFDVLNEMAQYIIDSDSINAVKILEKVYNSGNEPVQILSNLMYYFKNLLIVKNCDSKTTVELTNLNEAQIKELEKQKEVVETHQIVFLIEKIADYIKEIKATVNQQMWLEVALIDLSNLTNNTKLIDLQTRLQALESGTVTQTPQRRVATPVQSVPKTVVPQPIQPQSISKPVENSQPKPESKPVQNTVEEKAEEFTPMPKAKKLDPSTDIRSLWGELLSHIKSPSTHALLKLANPVKIAPDEVVITFKQSIFVKQASEGQKKIAIMEAADEMFGQKNTVVNIRTPLDSDIDLGKIVPAKPKPQPTVAPKTLAEPKSEISEEEAETVKEVTENKVQEEEKKTEKQHSNTFESDQSKMIKELFDGKYIN